MSKQTGWGSVAGEYRNSFIAREGSYHATLILPNLLRIVAPAPGMKVLEVGCGDGYVANALHEAGAEVEGSDVAASMVAQAKEANPKIRWYVASADNLSFAKNNFYDKVVVVLALQNIENINGAISEASRVLKSGGELVVVLNHPAFRIPKKSSWGYDESADIQYRRLDAYLTESSAEIDMDPGREKGKRTTVSFHRPLQLYIKLLVKHGLAVTGFEEWNSNKKSEPGPRQVAEDQARKEFPLFLMLKAKKLTQ